MNALKSEKTESTETGFAAKQIIRTALAPFRGAWPDEGRRIVQGPPLRDLLLRAIEYKRCFKRVLNAGSGEGGYSPYLLELPGIELLIDSDLAYGANAPQLHSKQVRMGASLTHVPLANESVDLILCSEVLEHIPDDGQALDELDRVLTPGGLLVITVPTPPAVPDVNHVREGYQLSQLSEMLRQRGFEVIENRFCMHYFFRLVLSTWPKWPWRTRFLLRGLSKLDTVTRTGRPMDLMVLAQKAVPEAANAKPVKANRNL